jgi:energy-coupling factor transporter ATP-binding protein EcfA2
MYGNLPNLDSIVIRHRALAEAHQRLEMSLMTTGYNIAIYGESGVGKTSLLRTFESQHKPTQENGKTEFPVLFASAPFRPTVKSLAQAILAALRAPNIARSTEDGTSHELVVAMRNAGTRLLLLDDFMNIGNGATRRHMIDIADWLIYITCQTETRLVIAGPPSCSDHVVQNMRFERRLGEPIRLERFIAILKSFQYEIAKQCDVSILLSPEMAYHMYCASGGLMGNLVELLKCGIGNAMHDTKSTISVNDFATDRSKMIGPKALENRLRISEPYATRAYAKL